MKKVPLRRCIVTREKLPKKELLRVVKDKEGNVFADETGKAGGRGAYIKKDLDVLEKAKKTKILERNLDIEIPENVYYDICEIIKRK